MDTRTLIYLAFSVLSTAITIGTILYKFGRFSAKLETKVDNMADWLRSIAGGNSPVCARHEERLDAHDRELEDHGRRIVTLEQRAPRKSR